MSLCARDPWLGARFGVHQQHMENHPEIVYLPWDRPILTTAVDWLLAEQGDGVPELGECLLLLHTRQAGRR